MEKIKRSGHISWSFYRGGKNDDCIINIIHSATREQKKNIKFSFYKIHILHTIL